MSYSISSLLLDYWQTLVSGMAARRENMPAELAGRMDAVGGHLVDPRSDEWLRLGPLRERILEWLKPEDIPAGAWFARTRFTGLLTPERHARYAGVGEPQADLIERVLAEPPERGATLPVSGYVYWALNVKSGAELEASLDIGVEPDDPLEWRAWRIVDDFHARAEFVRLLRSCAPSSDRMRDLDRDALFDSFVRLLYNAERRSGAAAIIYRALKAATYRRVEQYLDCVVPGERQRAREADLRMGDNYFTQVVDLVNPLVTAWLSVENHWLDEIPAGRAVETPLIGRQARPDLAADADGSLPQMAALFELAYDDIEPRTGRVWAPLEAAAGQMVADCLFELLLADDEAAAQLDGAVLLTPFLDLVRPDGVRRLAVVESPPSPSPESAPAERRDAAGKEDAGTSRRHASVVSMVRDLVEAPPGGRSTRWVREFEFVHEAALALQLGAGLKLPEVHELAAGLARYVVYDIGRDARHPDELAQHVSILSMLGIVLSAAKEQNIERLYQPALRRLRSLGKHEGISFTLLPTLERSITIMHSKDNNFRDAENQLLQALGYLDNVLRTTSRDSENAYINAREAAQQVALQAAGMYMRLAELYLAEPVLLQELPQEDRWNVLRETCWLGLRSSAYAYAELKYIEDTFTLPTQKTIDRAATKRWHVNTRCMHMRGLLLQATLDAVEVDRAPEHLRPGLEQGMVRALVDAVPAIYREATSVDVTFTSWGSASPALVNELTRVAMHYAFLSEMRPLRPGPSPEPLPFHLSGSVRRPGADGLSYHDFDLNGATAQLLKYSNDAGILACISPPEVRAALERRSIPADVLRETCRGREALRGLSPYRQWVRCDPQLHKLLSRPVTAEMARHVGAEFDPRRLRVREFLERHDKP